MLQFVLALVASIAIGSQFATATEPLAEPTMPAKLPGTLVPAAFSKAELSKEQLDHLRSAAEHLQRAGRQDEADKLIQQIAVIESGLAEAMLAKKEKELDALQAEVERLRKLTRRREIIELRFDLIEASAEAIKSAGLADAERITGTIVGGTEQFKILKDPAKVEESIDRLRKSGVIKVLAQPRMAALSGETLRFDSGAEVPVRGVSKSGQPVVHLARVGTQIEAKPTLMDNGKLRLDFHVRVTEKADSVHRNKNDHDVPTVIVRDVRSSVKMEPGHTCMLRGLKQHRVEAQELWTPPPETRDTQRTGAEVTETILMITAKRLDRNGQVRATEDRATSYYPVRASAVAPNPPKRAR